MVDFANKEPIPIITLRIERHNFQKSNMAIGKQVSSQAHLNDGIPFPILCKNNMYVKPNENMMMWLLQIDGVTLIYDARRGEHVDM